MNMSVRGWIIGMNELRGIGEKTIQRLLKQFPDPAKLAELPESEMLALGIPTGKIRRLQQLDADFIARTMSKYEEAGVKLLVWGDPGYPQLLREIADPPLVLYYRGRLDQLRQPCIGVVGTRRASLYGKRATRHIVTQLCAYGFGIVSGMARGIDTEAHAACLRENGSTIAVLGTGLDIHYPRENAALIDKVAQEGIVVSEIPIGTPMHPGLFPRRNRIIAGLSLGSLVVEADERSGALITADYAMQMNRDVFVVPGSIFSDQSRGTLQLLKQGAQCITGGEEIAAEYEGLLTADHAKDITQRMAKNLTPDERKVLQLLNQNEATIDELLEQTNFPFGHLHTVLLSLLIKKQVKKCSGSIYASLH